MSTEIAIGDARDLTARVSREFDEAVTSGLRLRGKAIVALSGGSIGPAFFPALAAAPVDWSRVHFFWIDERAVPPEDPASNYGLAARLWFAPASVPAACVHRMRGEDPDLARAARAAAHELIDVAGAPLRLDVAFVGVGEDGHVASIFPQEPSAPATTETDRGALIVPVYNSPKPPPRRLTMTMDALAMAARTIVIALGASKRHAIADLVAGHRETPAGQLLERASSSLLLIDHDAAGVK